jgi:hypothetical protein
MISSVAFRRRVRIEERRSGGRMNSMVSPPLTRSGGMMAQPSQKVVATIAGCSLLRHGVTIAVARLFTDVWVDDPSRQYALPSHPELLHEPGRGHILNITHSPNPEHPWLAQGPLDNCTSSLTHVAPSPIASGHDISDLRSMPLHPKPDHADRCALASQNQHPRKKPHPFPTPRCIAAGTLRFL